MSFFKLINFYSNPWGGENLTLGGGEIPVSPPLYETLYVTSFQEYNNNLVCFMPFRHPLHYVCDEDSIIIVVIVVVIVVVIIVHEILCFLLELSATEGPPLPESPQKEVPVVSSPPVVSTSTPQPKPPASPSHIEVTNGCYEKG